MHLQRQLRRPLQIFLRSLLLLRLLILYLVPLGLLLPYQTKVSLRQPWHLRLGMTPNDEISHA